MPYYEESDMSEYIAPALTGELVDVVDEHGEPTGLVVDKAIAHARGLRHPDVHVWVTDGRRLLQQQRAEDKTIMPGEWDISVSGHVMAGESYRDAAIRETAEELGRVWPPERFIPAGRMALDMYFEPGPWRHSVVGGNFVIVERNLRLEDLTLQPGEVIGTRLYDIDQLERDLADPATAGRHASQPLELWALGIAAMRDAVRQ